LSVQSQCCAWHSIAKAASRQRRRHILMTLRHPGMAGGGYGGSAPLASGLGVPLRSSRSANPGGLEAPVGAPPPCRRGGECTDFNPQHREQYYHDPNVTCACSYGIKCYRRNIEHLRQFCHPGDRNYRVGGVAFGVFKGKRIEPDFPTLRDLFNFCDPDESGNISDDEFHQAYAFIQALPKELFNEAGGLNSTVEEAWQAATHGSCTHLTFVQFAKWASDVKLGLPVGVDIHAGAKQSCRFVYSDGRTGNCPCADFKAPAAGAYLCECGHKRSAHCSDVSLHTVEEQEILLRLADKAKGGLKGMGGMIVKARRNGFDMVTDSAMKKDLQRILTESHKSMDNWTRDRGCSIHGRNKCEASCIFAHREPVPTGFELVRAEKNRNDALWHTFSVTRSAIAEEVSSGAIEGQNLFNPATHGAPRSSLDVTGTEDLDPRINEWRLFHGTGMGGIKGISATNFNIKMAGKGATWKGKGDDAGTPLYGFGAYLAERSTKADEYCDVIKDDGKALPIDVGCCAMLVCRAVGGFSRLVDSNEFDTTELRTDVFDGPYHSVFGDRECVLKKPFREIIIYDNAQIFPEFILYYKRKYD